MVQGKTFVLFRTIGKIIRLILKIAVIFFLIIPLLNLNILEFANLGNINYIVGGIIILGYFLVHFIAKKREEKCGNPKGDGILSQEINSKNIFIL